MKGKMGKPITQRDVARFLGVSYLTVNRALSEDLATSAKVGPLLRERILAAAAQLGYRKNLLASNLVLNKTSSIGVVWPHAAESYYLDVLGALERKAREQGYQVVITHRRSAGAGSGEEIEFLTTRMVDGLIVAPDDHGESPEVFDKLSQARIPVLLFNSFIPGLPCNYLGTDSRRGAMQACQHLQQLGHRRIAFVAGPANDYTNRCRLDGCRNAMEMAGLPSPLVLESGGFSVAHGRAVAERLLGSSPRPTAVLAANDSLAIGLFLELRRCGIRIPDELSLIGYAGMWEGGLLSRPLTTVAQPVEELGRRAAELIIGLIGHKPDTPIFEELPDQLLLRESCAPPPSPRPESDRG
jgi:LacI family transcriptional regulator